MVVAPSSPCHDHASSRYSVERQCCLRRATSKDFEDIAYDWNGNKGKARHSFLKVNLCTTENQEALLSHMERKSVSFVWMAPLSWAPLHIVESKEELAVNKAKQADENEMAEFTMSMATWCAARGALLAIPGHLSQNHVL